MKSSHSLDRLDVAFDDDRLIADASLLLPATLAQHMGLQELFDEHVDLGSHHAGANVGRKALTLIASALVGGMHRRCRCAASWGSGGGSGPPGGGTLHPGHVSAGLHLGACAPGGRGE